MEGHRSILVFSLITIFLLGLPDEAAAKRRSEQKVCGNDTGVMAPEHMELLRQRRSDLQLKCSHPNEKWHKSCGSADLVCPDCKRSVGVTDADI